VSRSTHAVVVFLGLGLLGQGALSLLLDATGLANNHLPERFANSDPLHASIHVVWGVGLLVLVARGITPAGAAQLLIWFGVFYSGLAIAGLTIHHPLGMRLDRGENVFHLIVGPGSLIIGLAATMRQHRAAVPA
jgi:hypothetical protein